jgi:predicted ATP-grasp superfamily ATP-dependent carboligase
MVDKRAGFFNVLLGRPLEPALATRALVLGDMDLVRPLHMAGIDSAAVAVARDPTRFSRCTRPLARWDPTSRNDELVDSLVEWGLSQVEPPVLYYQWDSHLLFVSRNRDRLSTAFTFVIDDAERVENLLDKQRFGELARELGLPVPPGRTLDPAAEAAPGDLEFPVIVKPCQRADDQWFTVHNSKALRLDSASELARLWPRLQAFGQPVVTQQFVPGDESRIESYHVYVDDSGSVRGEFTGRKIRTYPAEYGATTALTITAADDVAGLGRDIVESLGVRGVAKLDFKRGPDGRLHLLEVNPRFTLWHHAGARAGINIPAMVYEDLRGRRGTWPAKAREGVHWCSPYDLAAVRHDPRSLAQWIRFAANCEAKALWAPDDPLPLIATCVDRIIWRHHDPEPAAALAKR